MRRKRSAVRSGAVLAAAAMAFGVLGQVPPARASLSSNFVTGVPQDQYAGIAGGCGEYNGHVEPALRVSGSSDVYVSAVGQGGGTDVWNVRGQVGGLGSDPCALRYDGQPGIPRPAGRVIGGDTDIAIAPAISETGVQTVYVANLDNVGAIEVVHSDDGFTTSQSTVIPNGVPIADRPWMAAMSDATSFVSYISATLFTLPNIVVYRSDDHGQHYILQGAHPMVSGPSCAPRAGNLVVDHNTNILYSIYATDCSNITAVPGSNSKVVVIASADGGRTFVESPISCADGVSTSVFPNMSVTPSGTIWAAWSDGDGVYTASTPSFSEPWRCHGNSLSGTSVFDAFAPWLVATDSGVDLAYYARTSDGVWKVYFQQGFQLVFFGFIWGAPDPIDFVLRSGDSVSSLKEIVSMDVDPAGWAHLAYSRFLDHDNEIGYAVQIAGNQVGRHN
jgi:hypothetical protein